MERFHELLELFPEKIRPYIMNIAERHSMYGTKVEAQVVSAQTATVGELIEIVPEGDRFSYKFMERGYGIEVPAEFLDDASTASMLILRGEKHVS